MAPARATDELFGASTIFQDIHDDISCATRSDARVLISGEAGTGKDYIARLIHRRGDRRQQPCQIINCAGATDEIFVEWIRLLQTGTAVFQQISQIGSNAQDALVDFLDRAGDVRTIATANESLFDLVENGQFREDLYYRVNMIHIAVPPLRERRGDVGALVLESIRRFCAERESPEPTLQHDTLQALIDYSWPGNITELHGVVEELVVRANGGLVRSGTIPEILGSKVQSRRFFR